MNFAGTLVNHGLFIGAMNLRKGDVLPGNVLPTARPPSAVVLLRRTGRQNQASSAGKMPAAR
jgi:hypothetical protein